MAQFRIVSFKSRQMAARGRMISQIVTRYRIYRKFRLKNSHFYDQCGVYKVIFELSSLRPIYVFNSVVNIKLPVIRFTVYYR